jgi:hypothetical protein
MVLTWCKLIARAICGYHRTEARPGPPRSWRGEAVAAVGKHDPGIDPFRTLTIGRASDGPADGPTTRSPPIPPAPDALGGGGLP